jgi:hypothetical protein
MDEEVQGPELMYNMLRKFINVVVSLFKAGSRLLGST